MHVDTRHQAGYTVENPMYAYTTPRPSWTKVDLFIIHGCYICLRNTISNEKSDSDL